VPLDGLPRQKELSGDFWIRGAHSNEPGDLELALGQRSIADWATPPCADPLRAKPLPRDLGLSSRADFVGQLACGAEGRHGVVALEEVGLVETQPDLLHAELEPFGLAQRGPRRF
jgi:hypothetical protein